MVIYAKLLLTAFFWGGTFIAGRSLSENIGPFSASFLRFLIASFFLILFCTKIEGGFPDIKKRQVPGLILLGLTGIFAYNVFFFKGLKLIEAGRASLIIANNPVFITLLSACLFKEKLSGLKLGGISISVFGALVVISKGNPIMIFSEGFGWGEFYIFCCVLSWVSFSLIGKKVLGNLSPLVSITCASIVGSIALLLPALAEGMAANVGQYLFVDWASLFYLGFFGTVIGFVWYYDGIQKIGPTRAGLFINFVPVSAIFLAWLILKEPLTISLLIGAVLVSTGVYITNNSPSTR